MNVLKKPFELVHDFWLGDMAGIGIMRVLGFVAIPFAVLVFDGVLAFFGGSQFALGIFLLFYFFALISGFAVGVYYIKDIYGLDDDKMAARYFLSAFWGIGQPALYIPARDEGDVFEQKMVELIGGPAYLYISPGSAVLTETLDHSQNVFGQGVHVINRLERIRDMLDLRDQEDKTKELSATTKDGITVTVENIKFNYRVWDSRWETIYRDRAKAVRDPYPFSKQAVRDLAYNRSIQGDPDRPGKTRVTPWNVAVRIQVEGIITDYINQHKVDYVIAPRNYEKEPREEIRAKGYEAGFKKRLQDLGTYLLWWDPGEFKSKDEMVEKQVLASWQIDLSKQAAVTRAYGEAQQVASQEKGRAEAEADLLTSISHALEGIELPADRSRTLRRVILMRTAQVIKAMGAKADSKQNEDKEGTEKGDKLA